MEFVEKLKESIQGFIHSHFNIENSAQIDVKFQRLNGLSNAIYLVQLYDKTTNCKINEFIYRVFGEIGDVVDRNLEAQISNTLAGPGFSPEIYETDNKTYRMEEFIKNAQELPREEIREKHIIDKLIEILVSYTLISNVYTYYIYSDDLAQDYKIMIDQDVNSPTYKPERINQNIFDMSMNRMLNKAVINIAKFSDKVHKTLDKKIEKEFFQNLGEITNFIETYQTLFLDVFPKKGLFVLNHNDVHRLNILQKFDKDLMILDHEYAALNLIGIDIVNFMIESSFDYTTKTYPFFEYDSSKIDFADFFETFKVFLDKFEIKHSTSLSKEDYAKKYQQVRSYKYFLQLVCIISLFWCLYSVLYIDFDKVIQKQSFNYLTHAMNRLQIYRSALKELKQL